MALSLLVAAVVGRCDFYNTTDPSGYFCNAGAPAVYDLADVMNLTTAGAPGLFLHAVEGTRAAEVDDAPACNCRALVPKWMAMTLPSEFGDIFDDSVEDNCELTSLGFAWDVAPDGIDPTVLTIPPGRSVDAFAVFSGMPMKNMTEEDATTQYSFTFDGNPPDNEPPVKDYARTDINPDDACDVKIKWPSAYAISVGTGYCVADKTDNVNDFYTPYNFLPYTEDGFPDYNEPIIPKGHKSLNPTSGKREYPASAGVSMNDLLNDPNLELEGTRSMPSLVEIDPLGITPADIYFQSYSDISVPLWYQNQKGNTQFESCLTAEGFSGSHHQIEDDQGAGYPQLNAAGCLRSGLISIDTLRLPFYPFNTGSDNLIINTENSLPRLSSTEGNQNPLKATYSLSVRIFLQIINWYMAEFTVAINDGDFWSAATNANFVEPYNALSDSQICRGVDTSTSHQNKGPGPTHYTPNGQCISVTKFSNRNLQLLLLRHTMQYKTKSSYENLLLQKGFATKTFTAGKGLEWDDSGMYVQPMNSVNKQQYFIATGRGANPSAQPAPGKYVYPAVDFRAGSKYYGEEFDAGKFTDGFSDRLAWKTADDVGDAFASSKDGIPNQLIEFFVNSAAMNQNTATFQHGFNASSLFPVIRVADEWTCDNKKSQCQPNSYCDNINGFDDFQRCDQIFKCWINPMVCPSLNGMGQADSYNFYIKNVHDARLTPAFFNFPTHFVRPNETWSLAYIGESGLWAVPSVYRTRDYKSEHCMTASMPVPDTKVDETTICRKPGWNTKALEKDGITAAVGIAAAASGDYVLGGAVAVEGLVGLGEQIFNHETAKPICHRYTTHDYGTNGMRKAVTEKLKYLDPRPNKDAGFFETAGLTQLQLEDWCNAATVESDCSIPDLEYLTANNATSVANNITDRMKFRWLGCEWRQDTEKCVYRTVPLCHLWELVYPESFGADRPLQNCQPYEGNTPVWPLDGSGDTATPGFSPCVVIQQIYKEPQEGRNKMLPIPGTSMYLTAHKPLEDYENLRCVPLVTKIEVNNSNYKDLLKSGQLHREQNGVNCADPSSAANPDYAEICSRDLSFISGPSTGSQLANGIDYATNIHQQTVLQPFLSPFFFFDKESALLEKPVIDPNSPVQLQKKWAGGGATSDIPPVFSILSQTRTVNGAKVQFKYQMFENGDGPQNYTDQTGQVFQPTTANVILGTNGKDFPTCSIQEAFDPSTGFGVRMTGLGLAGCALAIDNITDIACKRVSRGTWPTTCTKPGMQFFTPDQIKNGNTVLFPSKAWQSVNPITRTVSKNLLGFELKPTTTVFNLRDHFTFGSEAEAKLFPHTHYCEMAFSTYIGCDNDPLSLEARRKLCTEQYGGILFGGARIIKVKNPCATIGEATTCWVFPGSNYGTVKSVLSLNPSPDTVKIVPFAWEVISTLMLNVLASNTTLTNYPSDWKTLEKLKMNATTAEHRIALVQEAISKTQEADLIQGMCRGGTPSDAIIDSLHTIIENARMDGGNYSFAGVESGTRIKNFTEAEVYPTLSEVGTDVVIRDVLITAAIQSRPPRFRPAGKECTVFQASGVGISFSDLEFDLTGCPEADAPIIFSGDTAAGALVENITTIGAKGATVLFLGRDTTAFLRSPELAVTGAVVRNITMKPEDASFVPVAFAATVDSATVGTLDLSNRCDVWTATSPTTATVSVTAPDLLLSGTFTLVDLTLQNGSGCLKIDNGRLGFGSPPCALWWLTEGAGVHPFGSPALCPNATSSAITFCKRCAIGFQEPIFDDKPRTPQWSMDAGFTGVPDVSDYVEINSDGMCIDINGVASPCHQSALVPEAPVPSLVCENAVGIDRYACAKDPTGSVVAVNPPNCTDDVIGAVGEFGGRGANFECNDGKYNVTAGGYGYRDKEPIRDLPGVQVRVETVYIQPGDDKLFDISLASGIGVFNVTEFTSAFGSVYEHEVHPASAHHTLTLYIFAIVGSGVLGLLVAFHLVEAWEGGA